MSTKNSNSSVDVPTMDDVRKAIKEAIAEHAASRDHPYATQVEPRFVTLSNENEVDSDSELTVATSKAVKMAYDLANTANQNANTRLAKDLNGADIPNKEEFVKNLCLEEIINAGKNIVTFTQAGFYTWDVPDELRNGKLNANVTVYGGGGGGGGGEIGALGGGGGGGGMSESCLSLSGVSNITIVVGAGGHGRLYQDPPSNGETSLFGKYLSATGGHAANDSQGGASGIGIGGQINSGTGCGQNATLIVTQNGGNGGGMNGGQGTKAGIAGGDGALIGSGGGGGDDVGGNGSAGAVIIKW